MLLIIINLTKITNKIRHLEMAIHCIENALSINDSEKMVIDQNH